MSTQDERKRVEKEKKLLEKIRAKDERADARAGDEFDDDLDDWFYNTDEKDKGWAK